MAEELDDILVELEEEEDLQPEGEDTVAASDEQGSSENEDEGKKRSRDRGAERRIAQLIAERNAAEDRVRAAEERLRAAEAGTTRLTEEASYYLDRAVTSEEEALDSALDGVKSKLRKAHEDGDADMVAEATVQLTKLEASKREVARQKDAKARYLADQEKRRAAPQQAQQQNGAARQQVQPSEKAVGWKEKNEGWFGKDPVMTNTAFTIHHVLVNTEGYDPESDEYYEELDARLREYFPQRFKGNGAGKTAKHGQADQLVAGAARAPARGKSKSIKLSSSQVQVAKDLGLTPQQYAKELLKIQQREQEA